MSCLKNIFLTSLLLSIIQPAWADFGNAFVANKRISTALDSPEKKISFRFTCQEDMNLTAAAVFCAEALKTPAYLLSLQEDLNGLPSGTPLSAASYIPQSQTWSAIPLASIPLIKGNIYHLVLEHDLYRGGGHPVGFIGPSNYSAFLSTDFPNHLHPNDGSPDPKTNVLLLEKNHWKELNQEPVYAVYGLGNKLQGNPYDHPGERPIFGDPSGKNGQTLQGESIHFHCGTAADGFAIRVKKRGNPKSPLNYSILKHLFHIHKTIPIYSARALTPDQAPVDFKWVTIGFGDKGKSNFSPECWFLVFQTDSGRPSPNPPGCEDCYLLSDVGNSGGLPDAANLTFDGGPHLSRAVVSNDGGDPLHWLDEFERDANVLVFGPACPPPFRIGFDPIPTPVPLEDNLDRIP